MKLPRVYVASKTKHAPMWKRFIDENPGVVVVSTWIFEAGEGDTLDYSELAHRCIDEVRASDAVLLYCEPSDVLKGALVEAGAALALRKPVVMVGDCDSISRVFRKSIWWWERGSLSDAADLLIQNYSIGTNLPESPHAAGDPGRAK